MLRLAAGIPVQVPRLPPVGNFGYIIAMIDAPEKLRRWFRITPDRVVLGLLAMEGLLFLSKRFEWSAFSQQKGWTEVLTVELVGVILLVMLLWFGASLVFRWRFQFSILSLLLLTVVVAIPCRWLAEAWMQGEAAEAIKKAGGTVGYDNGIGPSGGWVSGLTPPGPPWLLTLLGKDPFINVTEVDFIGLEFGDAELEHVKRLTQLRWLCLTGTKVSDAGLRQLKGLTQLQWLWLNGTKISDAGLECLKGLTQLQQLDLSRTDVSDAGLEHLQGLAKLRTLDLSYTDVGDNGLRNLQGLRQLQSLDLCCTKVRGAGLEHLKGLAHLRRLDLAGTKVSDADMKYLQTAMPKTRIQGGPIPAPRLK